MGQLDIGLVGVVSRTGVPRPGGGKADSMPEIVDWCFSSGDTVNVRKVSDIVMETYPPTPSLSPAACQWESQNHSGH